MATVYAVEDQDGETFSIYSSIKKAVKQLVINGYRVHDVEINPVQTIKLEQQVRREGYTFLFDCLGTMVGAVQSYEVQ